MDYKCHDISLHEIVTKYELSAMKYTVPDCRWNIITLPPRSWNSITGSYSPCLCCLNQKHGLCAKTACCVIISCATLVASNVLQFRHLNCSFCHLKGVTPWLIAKKWYKEESRQWSRFGWNCGSFLTVNGFQSSGSWSHLCQKGWYLFISLHLLALLTVTRVDFRIGPCRPFNPGGKMCEDTALRVGW